MLSPTMSSLVRSPLLQQPWWRPLSALRGIRVLALIFIVTGATLAATLAYAQSEAAARATNSSTPTAVENPAGGANPETAATPASGAKKPEAGGDELAALKQSPSVQWLAAKTGLSPQAAYWVSVILNFVAVLTLLIYLLRGRMPAFFRDRTSGIRKNIEEAGRVSQEAGKRLHDIEARLSHLDAEIDEMRASAEVEARAEEERLRTSTEEEERRLVAAAQKEIAVATDQARRDLKGYAAQLAVAMAAKKIQIDSPSDRLLVKQFGDQFTKDGE